ncbi:MAG: FliM/FliN family flagellar motor switch protein [Woeseia sp.]
MSEQDDKDVTNNIATDAAQAASSEPVLTDDEKSALLDGVASGKIEVQSSDGWQYASVAPFVISSRARLKSNSMPRLDSLNEQLAKQLAESCSNLLQAELEITARTTRCKPFGDFCEAWPSRSVAISFTASPLTGKALVVVDSVLIGPLVETFFGGNSPESIAHNQAAHSRGSLSIVQLFAVETLGILQTVWEPLKKLAPKREEMRVGLDLVDAISAGERVIISEFEVSLGAKGEDRGSFCIVWPEASLAPLRAALAGNARERDPAEDARWEKILRRRLPEVVVGLSSTVGQVRMSLRDVMRLKEGDIIGIDAPRVATVNAQGIPLIEGRYGVQAGRNAIETVAWLEPQIAIQRVKGH